MHALFYSFSFFISLYSYYSPSYSSLCCYSFSFFYTHFLLLLSLHILLFSSSSSFFFTPLIFLLSLHIIRFISLHFLFFFHLSLRILLFSSSFSMLFDFVTQKTVLAVGKTARRCEYEGQYTVERVPATIRRASPHTGWKPLTYQLDPGAELYRLGSIKEKLQLQNKRTVVARMLHTATPLMRRDATGGKGHCS